MREQIALASHSVEIHLLYASIVWVAAWILTSIRGGSATTKYWIWVVTSLNFILPLSPVLDAFRVARPFGIRTPDVIGDAGNVSLSGGVKGLVTGGVSGGPKGGVRGGVRNGTSGGVD